MNPNTKRSQTLRAKRKAEGLTEVRGIWAPIYHHFDIKAGAALFLHRVSRKVNA